MSGISTVRLSILLFVVLLLALPAKSIASTTRQALVIGNSSYEGFELTNPRRDAGAIAASLASHGYELHRGRAHYDLDFDAFQATIEDFLATVEDGGTTLIYYAGHGAASQGINYLIPILPPTVRLKSENDIRNRSIPMQGILERIQSINPTGVNVFLFDACRDAPVQRNARSINLTGLIPIDQGRQPRGTFVGFSTEYGAIALDDNDNGNSPFASAVLESLSERAAIPIELFYKSIANSVYLNTSGQQFPIQESKLIGEHCIVECQAFSLDNSLSDFGQLTVSATPLNANVCYLISGWSKPNCGAMMFLPIDRDVRITVNAKGHKPYSTITRLTSKSQLLQVSLQKKPDNTYKIIGGVAAAILVTGLLLSGESENSGSDVTHTLTLTRPTE